MYQPDNYFIYFLIVHRLIDEKLMVLSFCSAAKELKKTAKATQKKTAPAAAAPKAAKSAKTAQKAQKPAMKAAPRVGGKR